MTNDEAIYTLKNTAWLGWDKQKEKVTEAVRMAVEALKTQLPKEDITSDCISRQEAIRIASGYCHFTNVAKELEKLPSVRPVDKDINVSCKDAISRQAAIDTLTEYGNGRVLYIGVREAVRRIEQLPSVQPQRTCVNCGRTANNGGWYADGRTRCPIEEHYTLPKDGYCHLWEKRNVTDDDYPERREE